MSPDSRKSLYIDSHAHIYGAEFGDDFEAMLLRAAAASVAAIVVPGTDIESSRKAVQLAERYPQMYAAVGVHPHDAAAVSKDCFSIIRELAQSTDRVVAVGEIGLDFYRDRSPRETQEAVFRNFLRMAIEIDKPVIIHDRDAHDRILTILAEEGCHRGVLHCFSGDLAMAETAIEMGFYLSIPGTVTYPNNKQIVQVLDKISIDRIMIETDSPYLSPLPFRGKRNEPSYVPLVAEKLASLKGLTVADVARITTKNASDLFGIGCWDQSAKIAYRIRDSLYLNITNNCSNSCSFCPKFDDYTVKGHNLLLQDEPTLEEIIASIGTPENVTEIVFCGYGEPLLRLELLRDVAIAVKRLGIKVRINSDGQANLVHGRNILPELAGLVDSISVSLNAPDSSTYRRLCNTPFGDNGYSAVCDFIKDAVACIPEVTATAVTIPGVDIDACRKVAESLGAGFRVREYTELG